VSCLDENEVVALMEGRLGPEARAALDAHVAECVACRELLAGAAPPAASQETLPDPSRLESPTEAHGPGTYLSRYQVLRVIGAGGMGVVYAAHDPELDRKVAIKLLRHLDPERAGALKTRLLREARAMAQLTHPNVVTVYDVGTLGDQVFIVMELVAGTTLRGWLSQKPRTRAEVLSVFRRAGEGLAAAHAAGIVHRDVKPENILVSDEGRVLVTDFGLARSSGTAPAAPGNVPVEADRLTLTGALLGTPAYMSPEQLDGSEATAQSDLFSFSVALYEALYRVRPFAGDRIAQVREEIAHGRAREPGDARVPAWLRRLILRSLSDDPALRPASMQQLLDQLARDPALRRRRVAVTLGAALLAAALGTLGYTRATARSRLCRSGGERFDAVLAPARLSAVRARATSAPNPILAAEAAERRASLADRLAQFRRDWIATYEEACLAARVRGDQSEELLDLRMSCLDERLAGASEMVTLLERADPAIEQHLAQSRAPDTLAACSDRQELLAPVRPPRDPAVRAQVAELRKENARVYTLLDADQYKPALAQARAAVEQSRQVGYPPLTAESAAALGRALAESGAYGESARFLDEAIVVGEAAHADRVVAAARLSLLEAALATGRAKDLRRLARDAEGAVARLGGAPKLDSSLLAVRASVEEADGKYEAAEALLQQRIALVEKQKGLGPLELGYAENNLGAFLLDKRPTDAISHLDRAFAIESPILGAHHPEMLTLRLNRAQAIAQTRPSRELIATTQSLVDDARAAWGLDHVVFAKMLLLHSRALMSEPDRRAEAPAVTEKALAIYEKHVDPDHPERIAAEGELTEQLLEAHRYADGEPHARAFLEACEKNPDPTHQQLRGALSIDARILAGLHRAREARVLLERAVSLRTLEVTKNFPRQDAREDFALAQVLDELGERRRALALARSAQAGFLKATFPDDERLAAVRAFVAAHVGH
jgi:tetratricopeptide (TPR) repeat protein